MPPCVKIRRHFFQGKLLCQSRRLESILENLIWKIALGCEPERIAKTLSFHMNDGVVLIVAAGDVRVDNKKFKEKFHTKAKMLSFEEAEDLIGHTVGGICPFGVKEGVKIYLDNSLRRFKTVYPAAGSSNSAIELTLDELYIYSNCIEWVDVSKEKENAGG